MDNLLSIGQVLYTTVGWSNTWERQTVVRITPTQGITDRNIKVKREIHKNIHSEYESVYTVGRNGSFYLENESLKKEYAEQRLRRKAKNLLEGIDLKKLSLEQVEALYNFLQPLLPKEPTVQASVARKAE